MDNCHQIRRQNNYILMRQKKQYVKQINGKI